VDEECDVDMEEILHPIEPEVLLGSAKGFENFETLKKATKDCMYVGCGLWEGVDSVVFPSPSSDCEGKIWMVGQ
jgi:hypothetical protein